jgi:hypothetical protein
MPVEYRAGAEVPHYHVFFQLWIDASNPSFRHHWLVGDHAGDHAPATTTSANGTSDTSATNDADAPQLSAIAAPETRWAMVISLGGLVLALIAGRRPRQATVPVALIGRSLGPEPPPPRPAG